MPATTRHLSLAVGPAVAGWGSWDWVGMSLLEGLAGSFASRSFESWATPDTHAVVVVKHPPPQGWVEEVSRRSSIIYCPIDHYDDLAEIAAVPWLRLCSRIVVHCRRLEPHFAPFAKTEYLDHPLKHATATRRAFRGDGSLLWVGVRTNLPPLVAWVNAHPLPAPLEVLTNPEQPGIVPSPADFGFRPDHDIRIHEWTPERHLQFTAAARAAIDIKGDDFRSRHKPPAKALDFVASGLPLAMNPGSSPVEHLARLGLDIPSPLDTDRWLSEAYWKHTRRLGEKLTRDLSQSRVANRARKIIEAALAERRARPVSVTIPSPKAQPPSPHITPPTPQPAPRVLATPRHSLQLYGLMVTKDDYPIFGDWCRDQLPLYDAVVCLDGSEGDETARIAERFSERLIYLHERDSAIPHKTDHGLRRVVHREIFRRFGAGHWVMCCHADEFCYHDPRKVAAEADRGGFDMVSWFSPHFYPHPDELTDWPSRRHLLIHERHRHYHWSYQGDGLPWVEDRLYRAGSGVEWDDHTHGSVRPHGLSRKAPFHPIFRHFKVLVADPTWYDVSEGAAHYRTHWAGHARTGLPFPVRRLEDLFVRSVKNYTRCDRFDGTFPHSWNMGEEFRPDPLAVRRYEEAQRLAEHGEWERAQVILESLDAATLDRRVRALIHNDLAALSAVRGDRVSARGGFAAALEIDPDCVTARTNLATLGDDSTPDPIAPTPAVSEGSTRPVRIAVLSLLFNWPSTGGGNVHTAELTKFLAAAGYEVQHLYAKFDPWRIGRVTAATPHPAEGLVFSPAEWTAAAIVGRFRKAVNAFDPDWVVLTDSWNLKPLLAEAAGGRPYILRLQALECLCPLNNVRLLPGPDGRPGQCNRHQLATPGVCTRCVQELGHTSGDLHRAERSMAGVGTSKYRDYLFRAFADAHAVLAVNPLTAAMVEPYARDVRVVTAGMDPGRFPWPAPTSGLSPRTDGRTQLLFAGLTSEWMKGYAVLRQACQKLWASRHDFELVVTDDSLDGAADPFARYIGWQSQDDLPAIMSAADILVVPTVAQEALGRTAVEAMAAGKPVVASRIGGLPYTVAEGATGLLCQPGDPDNLAETITRLLEDPDLRARLGTAGRQRFEEHYSWPVIVEKHYRPLFGVPTRAGCR